MFDYINLNEEHDDSNKTKKINGHLTNSKKKSTNNEIVSTVLRKTGSRLRNL